MRRSEVLPAAAEFLGSPRFVSTLAVTIVSTGLFTHVILSLIGWPGLAAILGGLALLAGASLFSQRATLEWQGILPISLLVFVGWSSLSIFWAQSQWATAGALAYQLIFGGLGVFVALTRDNIQIVRAFGDTLRVVITLSLVLEILSGVLLDTPIHFLGIQGNLAEAGPIQGIMGSRNQMGLVSLVALITFGVELRTKSVSRDVGIYSLIGAALCLVFTQSPIVLLVVVAVFAAAAALLGLRRTTPERRTTWQVIIAITVVVSTIVVYLARSVIIRQLNATSESEVRIDLWRRLFDLSALHRLEGWGWVGTWNTQALPYSTIYSTTGAQQHSALNAPIDVLLQLGIVGFFAFVILLGLTFVRVWVLASRQQSTVLVWYALVMVALVAVSLAESSVLVDFGWLALTICSVKAAEQLSWRRRFTRTI